ncbi:ATP-binding protein [Verrucomicrobium sp. 3C]|uniref:ATP-binding protein n=1 Tax=Verrucomicrobium sp. 3C TaxID=1134055 RepID=UPI00037EE586|nr:ATP-binding protein [Verrucomicrobium sp. 3C]
MPNDRSRNVAVVGSPSTNTELTVDLLQEATEERLVGALTAFDAVQNGQCITSVGQIVSIELKNRWHEDSVFRNLVKRTGEIPPITNRQDTRTADLVVGATFRKSTNGFDPEVLGMVPPTGTPVYRVDQALLDRLLKVYRSEIVYLGRAYANDVLYPMWFKHFGSGPGGAGEAYHLGVFGKTGSGKSGLAKMTLCAYARHPQLGILVIDPQGEFSLELSGTRVGQQGLQLDQVVRGQGRAIHVFHIGDLQLDDWETFEEMLQSLRFLEQLGIPSRSADNSRKAAEVIRNKLEGTHRLDNLGTQQALDDALRAVADQNNATYIYSSARARELQQRVQRLQSDRNRLTQVFNDSWTPICQLFSAGQNRQRLFSYSQSGIINMLLGSPGATGPRPVIVIDISRQGNQRFWSEELQRRILGKLLKILVAQATSSLSTQQSANVLVLLDEAHRHAPSGRLEDDSEADQLRSLLRRAVRETRKYGIGWFFISQTLGGLDNEILQQLRILAFGFGLAMGTEFDRLRDFVGGDKRALELYQSFRDPQSFPRRDLQEFPFMAVGPVSPLAFSGKPFFFTMFTDMDEFRRFNNL